jgi:ketosteroid isomerase-like protein
MSNRQIAERYAEAIRTKDVATLREVVAPDIEVEYPQSGERIRGIDSYLGVLVNYPGGLPTADISKVRGDKDSVRVTSQAPFGLPVITVSGSGDTYILEGVGDYGDDAVFNVVVVVQLRDGHVASESWYFAPPFEPPEWRAPFVE